MKMFKAKQKAASLFAIFFFASCCILLARGRRPIEHTQPLRLKISNARLIVTSQNDDDVTEWKNQDRTAERKSENINTSLALQLKGSVYHSYLLDFTLRGETGLNTEDTDIVILGSSPSVEERDGTVNWNVYDARLTFLKKKPYSFSLLANQSSVRRDYDFFNRVTVDRRNYGAVMGYRRGPVPFTLSAIRTKETERDLPSPRKREGVNVLFQAEYDPPGVSQASLKYRFDQFEQRTKDSEPRETSVHTATLYDHAAFGEDETIQLESRLRYDLRDVDSLGLSRWRFQEFLSVRHARNLVSRYDYSYNYQESGSSDTSRHTASAGIRHELYKSLTSALIIEAQKSQVGSSAGNDKYSGIVEEIYRKHLGSIGELRLDLRTRLQTQEYLSAEETTLIIDENHFLGAGRTALLNHSVASPGSIAVLNADSNEQYLENRDYRLVSRGEFVEVQRISGGRIPESSTILVTYKASSQVSDRFTTQHTRLNGSVSLLEGLFRLWARREFVEDSGRESLILTDKDTAAFGVEVSASSLTALAEHEEVLSDILPRITTRYLLQVYLSLPASSVVSIDLGHSTVTYTDTDEKQSTYSYVARYNTRVSRFATVLLEGGWSDEEGDNYDRDFFTARGELALAVRRLAIRIVYEFRDIDTEDNLRERETVRAQLTRFF